ncbi:hypothetical protein BN1110_05482 [bacterium YEK0313]|nr:hypothetical protein BN1110_05482 [bacterium YEK0313]
MTTTIARKTDALGVYRLALWVNLLALAVVTIHRSAWPLPDSEYVHRLVSYEHGLIRRGLVGEIYSWFTDLVPPWAVRIEGFAAILAALALYATIFARTYRTRQLETLVLACFLFGSPLLFKNFVGNLGKFDVLGAIVAMLAVLMPLRRSTWWLIGGSSAVLLFVHHVHATIYLPTIYGILAIRSIGAAGRIDGHAMARIAVSLVLLAALFAYLLTATAAMVSPDAFLEGLHARALQPVPARQVMMWYSTIGEEFRQSLTMFPGHVRRAPIYAALVLIHLPLILFFARRIGALRTRAPLAYCGYLAVAAVVLAGFLVTNVITFDYARHLGNLALCFILISQAQIVVVDGPVTDASDIEPANRLVMAAVLAVAMLPWVGVVYPIL